MALPELKTPPSPLNRQIDMPARLDAELIKMRRSPREFQVIAIVRCKLCPPKSKTAYDLSHPLNLKNAGTWCELHGWLQFSSSTILPIGEERIVKKRKKAA